jgi:hypothetical protein
MKHYVYDDQGEFIAEAEQFRHPSRRGVSSTPPESSESKETPSPINFVRPTGARRWLAAHL